MKKDYLEIPEQYKNGLIDGAFLVYADAISLNDQGVKNKIVYISDHSIKGDVIVAKPEFKSLNDLKGKKVSVEGINSFSHLFVLSVLEKNGMKEGDVFIENVGAQDVVSALEKGDIVAGHTYGKGKSMAKEKGYVFLAYAGDVPGIITDTLVFNPKIIKERPEDIKAIVKALFEAKEFQKTNREEALQIIADAIGDTKESVAEGIDAVEYLDLQRNVEAMQKSDDIKGLYGSGKLISDFFATRGQITKSPNLAEIIEPRFVNEIANEQRK